MTSETRLGEACSLAIKQTNTQISGGPVISTTGKRFRALGSMLAVLLFFPGLVHAQSWTKLTNRFPGSQADTALLLTDGTALVHDACSPNWYKLTPDNT